MMDTAVLHTDLGALGEQDLSLLADAEVHELVVGLLRARSVLDGVLSSALDVWDARTIWSDDGSRSPAARIAAETGWKRSTAHQSVVRARRLRHLPATAAALRAGRITADYVDIMHQAAQVELDVAFEQYEPTLVDACAAVGWEEARDQIHRWVAEHDPDADDDRAERANAGRNLAAADTIDGLVHVQGLLPRIGGQEWLNELDRLERQLRLDDQTTGTVRTATQRRADALVEMARRSASLDDTEIGADRAPRITLSVVIGLNTAEHLCELIGGTRVAPGELVPVLGRCDIERIIFDGPDHEVRSVSSRRTFTGALRRAIQLRDRRCTHPCVCDVPADRCDIDHIVQHLHGGDTSQANGRALCSTHNRHPHLRDRLPHGWRTRRLPYGAIPDTGTTPRRRRRRGGARIDPDDPDDPDRA